MKHAPRYILKKLQKNTPSTTTLLSMAPLGLYKSATPSISIPSLVGPFDSFDIALQLTVLVNLFAGMNLPGLPTQFDPNDGTSAGLAFVPTDLDPNNQTRSDARRTYFDPYVSRSNFHIITGQHVTRILIDGVGSNNAVSTPAAEGNTDGNGPSSGDNNGFGFGPAGTIPPLTGKKSAPFTRSQDPRTSNLKITGVEIYAALH